MSTNTTIVSDEDTLHIVDALQDVKKAIKDLEKKKATLEQKLYNYMGEHDVMINPDTGEEFVTWKYTAGYLKFDSKKFELEKPLVYKRYLVMTEPQRRLLIK